MPPAPYPRARLFVEPMAPSPRHRGRMHIGLADLYRKRVIAITDDGSTTG